MTTVRTPLAAALATAALLTLGACGGGDDTPPAGNGATTNPPGGGSAVQLEAKDNAFAPKDLAVSAGTVTVVMRNTGVALHGFTAKDLGVDKDVKAGESVTFTFTAATPGTFKYTCKYHETVGMIGNVIVS